MASISFATFTFLLIFCPLAFGTVELWSITCMEFLAPMALLAYVLSRDSKNNWYSVPGFWPFVLLLLFMGVQLLPLPFELIRLLSPKAAYLYEPAQAVAGGRMPVPLSLHSKATLQELFRFSSYLIFYILTVQLLSDYRRLRKVLLIVAGLAGVIAFLAILQKFSSPDKIYWFRDVPRNAKPFGPWISRNHFAGFMEMIIPLAIVLSMHYRPHITYQIPLRERILSLFTLPRANLHLLLSFGVVLMAASLFASVSRGGILSCIMAMLFLIGLLALLNQGRRSLLAMTALALAALLLTTWLGWEPIISRFDRMVNQDGRFFDGRLLIWQDTLPMARDFWLTGAGFGSFQATYPIYNQGFGGGAIVDHAHNDFIELITEGGVVAIILVGWFLVAVFGGAWQQVRRRRDPFAALLFCGAVTGIVAIFFHSITDFNMHNAANGLYFFLLCGITISSAYSRRRWERRSTYLPPARAFSRYWAMVSVTFVLVGGMLYNAGQFVGAHHYQSIKDIYLNPRIPAERLATIRENAQKAVTADSLEADYLFAITNLAAFLGHNEEAQAGYAKVLQLKPTSAAFTSRIGGYFETLDPAIAKICFDRVAQLDKFTADPIKFVAVRLLKNGDKEGGFPLLRQAFALEPNSLEEYLALLQVNNFGLAEMESILPERVGHFQKFAAYLARIGQKDKASLFYRKSMTLLSNEPNVQAWFFLTPYAFFLGEKQFGDALAVMREGIQRMPGEPVLHIKAGDAYLREGIPYRAKEEYEKALTLAPNNKEAAEKLGSPTLEGI